MRAFLAAVALLGIAFASPSATAGGFSFSFSTGGWHVKHGHSFRHHGFRHHDFRRHHYFPRHKFRSSFVFTLPPVVYANPPVVYRYAPPPVVFAPPRVVYVPSAPPISAVPTSPPYVDNFGRYCRQVETTERLGESVHRDRGVACLFPDQVWRLVP